MGGYPDVGLQGRWRDGGETSAAEDNVLHCNVQNQIGNVSNSNCRSYPLDEFIVYQLVLLKGRFQEAIPYVRPKVSHFSITSKIHKPAGGPQTHDLHCTSAPDTLVAKIDRCLNEMVLECFSLAGRLYEFLIETFACIWT